MIEGSDSIRLLTTGSKHQKSNEQLPASRCAVSDKPIGICGPFFCGNDTALPGLDRVNELSSVKVMVSATETSKMPEIKPTDRNTKVEVKNQKSYRCVPCDKTMNTSKQYEEHCSGRAHLKKLSVGNHSKSDASKLIPSKSANDLLVLPTDSCDKTVWWPCDVCGTKMNSAEHLENHKLGAQHLKKMKLLAGLELVKSSQRPILVVEPTEKCDSQQHICNCINSLSSTITETLLVKISISSPSSSSLGEECRKCLSDEKSHKNAMKGIDSTLEADESAMCFHPDPTPCSFKDQTVCSDGTQQSQLPSYLYLRHNKILIYSRSGKELVYKRAALAAENNCCEIGAPRIEFVQSEKQRAQSQTSEACSKEASKLPAQRTNCESPGSELRTAKVNADEATRVALNKCSTDDCAIEADFCISTGSCIHPSCIFHCELCNKHMNSEDGKTMHVEGKTHAENLRRSTELSDTSASPYGSRFRFYCQLCGVPFNTIKDKVKHENGQQHKGKVLRSVPAPLRDLPVVVRTLSNVDDNISDLTKSKPREYQVELYRKAMLSDSICFLPTGTGKTLVALLAMSRMLTLNPHHSVVFLVDKVLLALQQSKVIKEELGHKEYQRWNVSSKSMEMRKLRIAMLCGQKEDLHGAALSEQDVIVVTAAFYINLLKWKSARWTDSCFIIFDEVHHCHKDHPFRNVIVKSGHLSLGEKFRPKILGLSASPASRDTATATVFTLRELLANLGATRIIAVEKHRDELANYQSNTELVVREVNYSPDEKVLRTVLDVYFKECCRRLANISNIPELNMAFDSDCTDMEQQLNSDFIGSLLDGIHLAETSQGFDKLTFGVLSAHIEVIGQAMIALESLGLNCSIEELQVLVDASFFGSFQKAKELDLPCDQLRLLTENFIRKDDSMDSENVRKDKVILENTAIFVNLLEELLNWWDGDSTHGGMSLVLVKQRSMATSLARLLQRNAELKERKIRVTHVVGHGRGVSDDGMPVSRQARVMNDIVRRNFDVIVATSVAEEGVDLPICDLVVQLDAPDCVRALVQVRGRARRSGSRFVAFCRDDMQRLKLDDLRRHEASMVDAVNQIIAEQNSSV